MNFLFNFWLAPETNLLIERCFDMNDEENEVFDADNTVVEDIQRLLERAGAYCSEESLRDQGQNFMMTGVLPYIYKYANILFNLTKFEVKIKGVNPYSQNQQQSGSVNDLYNSIKLARGLLKVYVDHISTIDKLSDVKVSASIVSEMNSQKFDLMVDKKERSENHMFNRGVFQQDMLTKKLTRICELIIQDIEHHYEDSKFIEEILRYQTREQESAETMRENSQKEINWSSQKLDILMD